MRQNLAWNRDSRNTLHSLFNHRAVITSILLCVDFVISFFAIFFFLGDFEQCFSFMPPFELPLLWSFCNV